MEINNVIVEEISVDETNRIGVVTSTLYEFQEPRWVSTHRERQGRRLGPITLLDEFEDRNELLNLTIRQFGKRQLHTERKSRHLTISYRDRWTIPPWTVYALVLPKGFIASHIRLLAEPAGTKPDLQLGVSHDDRLFYHTVFLWTEGRYIFDIEARLEENPRRYQELLQSAEAVRGTNSYQRLREAIGRGGASPDFWFKLLELGGKLIGMP